MTQINKYRLYIFSAIVVVLISLADPPAFSAISYESNLVNEMKVLTSGPVHEAFAEPVILDPEPGMLVNKAPPEPIEELPPEEKPEGEDMKWISGYWAWDDERNDFIWISGIWRETPPGRGWVPGYWTAAGNSFQWISGYWVDANRDGVEYLSAPPDTVEAGPNVSAPSSNYDWVPGCWIWHRGRYVWSPGFWTEMYPDWVWVPAHYVWSPAGFIFVSGYWDYAVAHRGVLFAPIFFGPSVHIRPWGFYHRPTIVVDLRLFSDFFYLRPHYRHYYFGKRYASHHHRRGILSRHSIRGRRYAYDPIFMHQRWKNRHARNLGHHRSKRYRLHHEEKKAQPKHGLKARGKSRNFGKKSHVRKSGVRMPGHRVMKNRNDSPRHSQVRRKTDAPRKQPKGNVRGRDNKRVLHVNQASSTSHQRSPDEVRPRQGDKGRFNFAGNSEKKVKKRGGESNTRRHLSRSNIGKPFRSVKQSRNHSNKRNQFRR